ncbi:MAG: hypothetical protein Q9M36_00880 [Sulfurovum sp.]|nr:hypothetical protein [Sulfurovum sp.]
MLSLCSLADTIDKHLQTYGSSLPSVLHSTQDLQDYLSRHKNATRLEQLAFAYQTLLETWHHIPDPKGKR